MKQYIFIQLERTELVKAASPEYEKFFKAWKEID